MSLFRKKNMKKIKIYYGLSGTFKTTTIQKENGPNSSTVWSMIKLWKDLESTEFKGKTEINHLNFSILHLCNLSNVLKSESDIVLVERGVTDSLYYWFMENEEVDESWSWIESIVKKEMDLCGECEIEKILLLQRDEEFIENVILKEPHRKAIFPNKEAYLKEQEKYAEFTRRYNNITKEITINNAEEYLKELGITITNINN